MNFVLTKNSNMIYIKFRASDEVRNDVINDVTNEVIPLPDKTSGEQTIVHTKMRS